MPALRRQARRALLAAGLSVCASPLAANTASAEAPEHQLLRAVQLARDGRSVEALKDLEALTRREPNFRLAHLLYADLLAARAGGKARPLQLAQVGDSRLNDLVEEARARLSGAQADPAPGQVPNTVLRLSGHHPHIIVVDLPRLRLYVLENRNGELSVLHHHYAAMGRNGAGKQVMGDLRTPIGVYHITQWLADAGLPELYGAGAFPVSYPNPWDRFKGRTGSGIWLHGVPRDTYTRAPRSSEGCVTMANEDLLALRPYVRSGQTPVVFTDDLQWLSREQAQADTGDWLARIERWRADWASRDTQRYLAHYADDFTTVGMDRAAFGRHKERVNAAKRYIEIRLSDLSLFRYPGAGEPLVLAEFTMDYRSDNFTAVAQKQQFWRRDRNGQWRIFREENR